MSALWGRVCSQTAPENCTGKGVFVSISGLGLPAGNIMVIFSCSFE